MNQQSTPQEIPSIPNPEPEIVPSYRPQPEIDVPVDPIAPSGPQGPEIIPDTSPVEVPQPDTQ